MAYFIIKSSVHNWSGKEWSANPAKIYSSFQDCSDAIKHYWYGPGNMNNQFDHRGVLFIPLTETKAQKLISENKARF